MKIAILASMFFTEIKELSEKKDKNGNVIKEGKDKIVFGGAERYLVELCKFFQSMGHQVKVYQPLFNTNRIIEKRYRGIPIMCLGVKGSRWDYTTNLELNMRFNEMAIFDDLRIYFATFLCYPKVISPCISICHGIWWEQMYGSYKQYTQEQREEFLKRQLYGMTAPDVCVTVDSNIKKVISSIEPGAESKMRIIYNFVNTKEFYPKKERNWNKLRVLFPRRLTILRGINEFIKATKDDVDLAREKIKETAEYKRIARENPPYLNKYVNKVLKDFIKYDYVVVGQCHDEDAGAQFANYYKNSPHIKFMSKDMTEMSDIYRNVDISVIPTNSCEGLSLSMLESMASGLPVITTPVGGLGDAIIHGYNGFVFENNYEELFHYVDALGSDDEMRKIMGQRSLQIARECFDIRIWHERWKKLLMNFGFMPEKQHYIKKPKQKLVAMMLTHNEADRYLERVIENTLKFCDAIVVLDDQSKDGTRKVVRKLIGKYKDRIFLKPAQNTWEDETKLRNELLQTTIKLTNPDWVIAVDADEIYEDGMKDEAEMIMDQDVSWAGFRFFDMWDDEEHYRDEDKWPAATTHGPRMFKIGCVKEYKWPNKKRHCGSIPVNVLSKPGIRSAVRVKHLGYVKKADRHRKYQDKIADDLDNKFYPIETYKAIIDKNPKLVKWSDDNPWQTGKKVIAYPPGMEWSNMRQRPHHLLSFMAKDRNRVFFGDESAPGVGEVEPYMTLVNDWENCNFIKDVDIVYLTSFGQLKYIKNMKYKTLIYDCVDHMGTSDHWLIKNADYVLCASKKLYDRNVLLNPKGKVIYVPNACQYEHFSNTSDPAENITGYMGAITGCIDSPIIAKIGKKYKTIVIGPKKTEVKNTLENITMTGMIHYNLLPQVLKNIKVGIIPFRTNHDYLRYCDPIKVYEYLAAGRPVVATPIPELKPLAEKGLIHLVENDDLDKWIEEIGKAMTEYPNKKGQEWAKGQTWQHRWDKIKKEVDVLG